MAATALLALGDVAASDDDAHAAYGAAHSLSAAVAATRAAAVHVTACHPRWWACVSAASAAAEADAATRVAAAGGGAWRWLVPLCATALAALGACAVGRPAATAEGSAPNPLEEEARAAGACRLRRQRRPRRPCRPWPGRSGRSPGTRRKGGGKKPIAPSSPLSARRAESAADGEWSVVAAARPAERRAPKPAAISTDELTASCDGSDISTRSETSSAQPTGASSPVRPGYTASSCAPFYALIGADEPAEPLTWTCGRMHPLNPLRNERCEACEFARALN